MNKRKILIGLMAFLLAIGIYLFWQSRNGEANHMNLAQTVGSTKQGGKVKVREMTFESGGNRIYGQLMIPDSKKPVPVVIMSHGFGGNHNQESTMQERLAENGIAVFSFDFAGGSGYEEGRSEGSMLDMTVDTEQENLEDALSLVEGLKEVDSNNISLIGASQGGVVSTQVALKVGNRIKGLYLLYPAYSMFDDARERFASLDDIPETYDFMGLTVSRSYFSTLYDRDIYKEIKNYDKPVWIFHGTSDALVPVSYSQRAAKVYKNAKLVTLKGEGHGFSKSAQERVAQDILRQIKH